MDDHRKIKTLNIRLRMLLNDVIDYNRGSFFGVRAMDPEVLHLWLEYNNLLSELDTVFPEMFRDFYDLSYPDPYVASEDSFYKEGTMIYKPEHFSPLRMKVAKMIDILNNSISAQSA